MEKKEKPKYLLQFSLRSNILIALFVASALGLVFNLNSWVISEVRKQSTRPIYFDKYSNSGRIIALPYDNVGTFRDVIFKIETPEHELIFDGLGNQYLDFGATGLGNKLGVISTIENRAVTWCPDENFVTLWDTERGAIISKLYHYGMVSGANFNPRKKIIATFGKDSSIFLWSSSTGSFLGTLSGHSDEVLGLSFSANGETAASCGKDGFIIHWDISAMDMLSQKFLGPISPLLGGISPDGNLVAISPDGKRVSIINLRSNMEVMQFAGSNNDLISVNFSSTGNLLVVHDWRLLSGVEKVERHAAIWDLRTQEQVLSIRHPVSPIIFDSDDSTAIVAFGEEHNEIVVWRNAEIRSSESIMVQSPIQALAISPSGDRMAVSGEAGVFLYDVELSITHIYTFETITSSCLLAFQEGSGELFAGRQDESIFLIRRRPEYWWGIFYIPTFWSTVTFFILVILNTIFWKIDN